MQKMLDQVLHLFKIMKSSSTWHRMYQCVFVLVVQLKNDQANMLLFRLIDYKVVEQFNKLWTVTDVLAVKYNLKCRILWYWISRQ